MLSEEMNHAPVRTIRSVVAGRPALEWGRKKPWGEDMSFTVRVGLRYGRTEKEQNLV